MARLTYTKPCELLLKNYFDTWEGKSVEKLSEVFEEDARYFEKPFQKPIQGLKEISKYWLTHVLLQKNFKLKILKSFCYENLAFAEWECEFDFKNIHHKLKGILYLEVNPKTKLASSLTEYFSTEKS